VTDKDITAGIKAATGLDIDRHRVKVAGHIKKLGKYTAKVSLQGQVSANVNISVEAI
jgi:large subunit ribosomal protein L9